MKVSTALLGLAQGAGLAAALSPAQWRSKSIYQVLTDRFALTDGSTTASCDTNLYCGGTWQGIINKLDYIQGMGFTAVSSNMSHLPPRQKKMLIWHTDLDIASRRELTPIYG